MCQALLPGFFISFILLLSIFVSASGNFTVVIIGVYGTTSYSDMRIIGPGIKIALDKVQQIYPVLANSFRAEIWQKPFQNESCDRLEHNVAYAAAETYYEKLGSSHPVSAFIGTTCAFADKQLLDLLNFWNLPLLEGSNMAAFIADRKRYPLAMGFSYTQTRAGEFFYKVIRYYNWTYVTALFNANEPQWRSMSSALDYFKDRPDVRLEIVPILLDNITRSVYGAHRKSRVSIILANPRVIRELMIAASKLGYTSGDHVYIAGAYFKTKYQFGTPKWQINSTSDQEARRAFQSLFLVKQHIISSDKFHEFDTAVQQMSLRDYYQSIPPDDEVNIHAMAFHDAILAYGEIVNNSLKNGENVFDGRRLLRHFTNRTFSGIRVSFTLNQDNNVPGHFELWNFRTNISDFLKIIDFPDTAKEIYTMSHAEWASGEDFPPPSQPYCWFDDNNPECLIRNQLINIYSAVGVMMAVFCIILIVIYWNG